MSHLTKDVFTPARPAGLAFVERHALNDRLVESLTNPGKQIVIYGRSGSGKTTLLLNKLKQTYEDHITVQCTSGQTADSLIASAFDKLGPFYESESIVNQGRGVDMGLKATYFGIESQIDVSRTTSQTSRSSRYLPPQLTAQTLASLLGAARCALILEDFHNIADSEKAKLAQMMKVFTDSSVEYPEAKLIFVGAVDTAREVIKYNPDMRNRVAEIYVPLMSDPELGEILEKGEDLLNLRIQTSAKDEIISRSEGIASICHQLAYYACTSHGVIETSPVTVTISELDVDDALDRFFQDQSDTMKRLIENAIRQSPKAKHDNCRLILMALCDRDSSDGAKASAIFEKIRASVPSYPRSNLTRYLKELQNDNRGELLCYDRASLLYSFANPFLRAFAIMYFGVTPNKKSQIEKQASESIPDGLDDKRRQELIAEIVEKIIGNYKSR